MNLQMMPALNEFASTGEADTEEPSRRYIEVKKVEMPSQHMVNGLILKKGQRDLQASFKVQY